MIHTRIRFLILILLLPILALTLTACYTITLKEKRVDGLGSAISIKLPGNLQSFDLPIPVSPAASLIMKAADSTVKTTPVFTSPFTPTVSTSEKWPMTSI